MKTAEQILRQDKYKDLNNLVLICEAMEAYHASRLESGIKAKALKKNRTDEWYHINWETERLERGSMFPECFGGDDPIADCVHDGIFVPCDAELVNIIILEDK